MLPFDTNHPKVASHDDLHFPPGIRIMFRAKWFTDFHQKDQAFYLYEIGASETSGARLEGVYLTFEEVLAKVPDDPPAPLAMSLENGEQPASPEAIPAIVAPGGSISTGEEQEDLNRPWRSTLLDEGLANLNLPSGLVGILKRNGVNTIGALILSTRKDLLSIRGFGSEKLSTVEKTLKDQGLSLRTSPAGNK